MNTSETSINNSCPCGSRRSYEECCGLYIGGERSAPTAESLMRSRYTAYTLQDNDYLLATWHPDTRPAGNPADDDSTTWTGLEVIRTEEGMEKDHEGVVEFVAYCKTKGGAPSHLHEISQFVHENGQWYYLDGKGQEPVRRNSPKVGRNDPCPCGSGKKYKKCCGR